MLSAEYRAAPDSSFSVKALIAVRPPIVPLAAAQPSLAAATVRSTTPPFDEPAMSRAPVATSAAVCTPVLTASAVLVTPRPTASAVLVTPRPALASVLPTALAPAASAPDSFGKVSLNQSFALSKKDLFSDATSVLVCTVESAWRLACFSTADREASSLSGITASADTSARTAVPAALMKLACPGSAAAAVLTTSGEAGRPEPCFSRYGRRSR